MVFVVDDDPVIRYTLKRYLAEFGFEIWTVTNGFDVLLLCMYMIPDLIISDICMPKLDGVSLLKGLKNNETTRDVPVIFMSAHHTEQIMEEARQLGARYFLVKPFTLKYLNHVLRRAMPNLMAQEPEKSIEKIGTEFELEEECNHRE